MATKTLVVSRATYAGIVARLHMTGIAPNSINGEIDMSGIVLVRQGRATVVHAAGVPCGGDRRSGRSVLSSDRAEDVTCRHRACKRRTL